MAKGRKEDANAATQPSGGAGSDVARVTRASPEKSAGNGAPHARDKGRGDDTDAPHTATAAPPAADDDDARKKNLAMLSWSASPALEAILRSLEDGQRAIDEAKRYLEERLAPFQACLAEQRQSMDKALRQLDIRIKPLKQYLQGQEQNLARVDAHLETQLKDQFDEFNRYLAEQRRILADAGRYLEEQPRPFRIYVDEQQATVEMIYQDIEQRLLPFTEHVREQQKILERIAHPDVLDEFRALLEFMAERQKAVDSFAATTHVKPDELLKETVELSRKYRSVGGGRYTLLARVIERCRTADEAFQRSLKPTPVPAAEPLDDAPRAAGYMPSPLDRLSIE
jgi:hypothetical protein